MLGMNRFRPLLSLLPIVALLACSEQEPVGPAATPEKNELAVSAYATTWKIADYWCISFDGDKGTMKLRMTQGGEDPSYSYNTVTGTIDWKRHADASVGGVVYKLKDPEQDRVYGESFDFQTRVGTVIANRHFQAYRKDGGANLLKGQSSDSRTGGNVKYWTATRGACI